jgi:hypothetical protein
VIDLRWHAIHPGFERAADQLQAHWLIWLGVLVTLAAAAVGARRVLSSWYSGYRLLLLASVAYALSSAWHFWEHANLRDPVAPTCWWRSARPRSWPAPSRRPSRRRRRRVRSA